MIKDLLGKFILFIEKLQKKRAEKKAKKQQGEGKPQSRTGYLVRRGLLAVFLTCMFTGIFTACVFAWYVFVYVDGEFDLSGVDNSLGYTTLIYGNNNGETVQIDELHGTENRKWANIDEISPYLQNAVVAIVQSVLLSVLQRVTIRTVVRL